MEKSWEEEIKEIEEKIEDEAPSKFWHYTTRTFQVIIALLLISYLIIDPTVREVIIGFFESSSARGNTFQHENKSIIFQDGTYPELKEMFRDNQEAEFKACLKGEVTDKEYLVKEITTPETYSQHVFRVVSEPCTSGTIIDLHSHPVQQCVASDVDIQSLRKIQSENPRRLMAVMCTEERISFYG